MTALLDEPEDEPLRLHPGLAQVYRAKVDELVQALNAEGAKNEAGRILRGLVSEIRLIPEADSMTIELVGELAAIMALEGPLNAKAPGAAQGCSVTMVAGAGFEPATFRL
ncbi:MAG: hypothetical protein M5U35_00140 [Roseovarius sp.]|nr:hypothetical protein [Roseovarius sp.]